MRAYEASALIGAEPARIWSVLTDVAGWPGWDSGVTKVDGDMAPGRKLVIHVEGNNRPFPVKVAAFEAPHRVVLRGGMPLGLFVGERTYTLTPEPGGTRFDMREEYRGPMAGLIFKSIPDLGPAFRRFADGLKQRSE